MSALDTKALRALAEAATPGPWENNGGTFEADAGRVARVAVYSWACDDERAAWFDANTAFAGAVLSPDVVLALLDRLERDERIVEAAQALVGAEDAVHALGEDDNGIREQGACRRANEALRAALAVSR